MIHDLFQSTMYMYFSKQKYVIFCMIKWETIVILKENLPYRPSFTACTYNVYITEFRKRKTNNWLINDWGDH